MKYPRYPAYKDSGVEWIGEIPEHWNIARLKRVCHFKYGSSLSDEYRTPGKYPVFGSNGIIGYNGQINTKSPVIIIGRKGSFGKVTYSNFPGFAIDTTFFVDEGISKVNLKWLFYVLGTLDLDSSSKDTGVPGLSREDAYEKVLPVPPLKEQNRLIKFLNNQISKVDSLTHKFNNMIELLKEKRQAIITHAVTKGLDPNVPMKDSGVEWIGEIPKKWKILQLKRVMSCNDEVIPENTSPDEELAYVEISDVDYPKGITDVKVLKFKNSPSRARRKVREGDIIISTVRTYLKAIAEIRNPPINMVVSTGFAVLRPRNIQQTFAKYVLSSKYFLEMTISESIGVGYPAINTDKLISIKIPVPNNDTQSKINEFLDHEIYKIDSLEFKLQKMTNILNEYRSSLISSAVTGKIDVRNVHINESLEYQ